MALETWQRVWREGYAPGLSDNALAALKQALLEDDPALMQGATTTPPPLQCVQDWPVEAACAVGFCGWQGESLETVAEVEEYFCRMNYEADQRMGEAAACRWFLNWFDETPRPDMLELLLDEVVYEQARRATAQQIKESKTVTATV